MAFLSSAADNYEEPIYTQRLTFAIIPVKLAGSLAFGTCEEGRLLK
jgi:hypothetical protein